MCSCVRKYVCERECVTCLATQTIADTCISVGFNLFVCVVYVSVCECVSVRVKACVCVVCVRLFVHACVCL